MARVGLGDISSGDPAGAILLRAGCGPSHPLRLASCATCHARPAAGVGIPGTSLLLGLRGRHQTMTWRVAAYRPGPAAPHVTRGGSDRDTAGSLPARAF